MTWLTVTGLEERLSYTSTDPVYMDFAGDDITISESDTNSIVNLSAGTVEGWIKWDTVSSNRVVLSYGGNNNDQGFLLLSQDSSSNKIGFSTWRDNGTACLYTGNTYSSCNLVGYWNHLVATYDN